MQLDMHYYGTYAMARAGGLTPKACKIIATAAQFVDDNAASSHILFQDGGRIDAQATAHHVGSVIKNRDAEDQRQVWVPFHFLPGNEGNGFTERLVCRKDSTIAQEMVKHNLSFAGHEVGVYLIGVTAHVYVDTFSHHGFSGVGSRWNKIDNDTLEFDKTDMDPDIRDYIDKKREKFFRDYGSAGGWVANIKSWLAETVSGALGHGAVATYPDRPYLRWSFEYEDPASDPIPRDNPTDFLDGCQALHKMFTQFGNKNSAWSAGDGVKFSAIKGAVKEVLAFEARKKDRVALWCKVAKKGQLGGKKFTIPAYNEKEWLREAANLNSRENSAMALDSGLYRFYQAASIHRQYVLRDLLPKYDLVVA
ncbi:MAG: hypothetical protein JSU63_14865 [Phycisphaerales bacterium]|nr:MAG: hypothetical protein JSU63_14865 [Phycisphaerales bacterium]